jgi:hypothetical protein
MLANDGPKTAMWVPHFSLTFYRDFLNKTGAIRNKCWNRPPLPSPRERAPESVWESSAIPGKKIKLSKKLSKKWLKTANF